MNNKFVVLSLILLVVLFWAGNFIAISHVTKELDVFLALALRLTLVAIFLASLLRKKVSKNDMFFLFVASVILVPGHFGFLFLSIANTKSVGGVSVLIQLAIPFSVIFAWIIYKDRPSNLRILGLVIAFIGIAYLLFEPSMLENQKAFLMAIISAFCLGLYFIIVKKIKEVSAMAIIAWSSLFGAPMMFLLAFLNDASFTSILNIEHSSTVYGFLYTVIAGSILGHGIWAYLVKTQDISFISPFLLLVPIFSVFLSVVLLDEKLTLNFIILTLVIIFGIFLVFISKNVKSN